MRLHLERIDRVRRDVRLTRLIYAAEWLLVYSLALYLLVKLTQ